MPLASALVLRLAARAARALASAPTITATSTSPDVIALVLSGNAKPVLLGMACGFLGGIASARLLRHLLFGVSPFDPVALAAVAGIVALAGFVASCVPVRRAIRLDPVQALRHE